MSSEVTKFDQIGHNWWNLKDGELRLLHKINPLRIEFILKNLAKHFGLLVGNDLTGLKILDIGCGGGLVTIPMARLGAEVTGIDPSNQAIIAANGAAEEVGLTNCQHICVEPESFASADKFDVVLCLDVLEHVDNLSATIGCIARFLKQDGAVVISTINKTPRSFVEAIVAAEYLLRMLPTGTHEYTKFIKPSSLQKEFSNYNLIIKKMNGISFSLLNQKWRLSEDVDVNYMAYLR